MVKELYQLLGAVLLGPFLQQRSGSVQTMTTIQNKSANSGISGNEESVIFIQKSYLDSLKSKKAPGDDLTVIVDDSFQYGQNKEKTRRWLAYHNKKNEAYQVS
jgi:hypothetical protein